MPAPPDIEPDASPTVCIELNESWVSWLQGRVWNMEHLDWSQPWDDAAIDRSSRLADLLVGGECNGGGTLDAYRKLIVDTEDRIINSATIVAVSPLDNIDINSAGPGSAKYRITWNVLFRVTSTIEWNVYMYRDGVNITSPYPFFTYLHGPVRERLAMSVIDLDVPEGPHNYEVRYNDELGIGRIEYEITGQQQVRMLEAYRVE